MRSIVTGLALVGGVLAVAGGVALGAFTLVNPKHWMLPQLEHAWILAVGGLLFATVFALAARVSAPSAPDGAAAPHAIATPVAPPAAVAPAPVMQKGAADAATALQQMRTYIGIEMWDLALDKADEILARWPGTTEAETVSKNINELRWKAEPKPAPSSPPAKPDTRRHEEATKMIQHVRTYMDLEMWDLAKERALAIAKLDPNGPDAESAGHLLVEINEKSKRAQQRTIVE